LAGFELHDHAVRVIAFSPQGKEILGVPAGERLELPTVVVPGRERFAESLTAAMRREWNWEVICLFTPAVESRPQSGHEHYVVECWREIDANSRRTRWIPVLSLTPKSFLHVDDYWYLRDALDESGVSRERGARPFARQGWFQQLRAWASEAIIPFGLALRDGFQQLNASPSFSLIRFETSGTPIWFKAVGEPSLHEYEISLLLARLFPDFVAPVVAQRDDWHGWLSFEVSGNHLEETRLIGQWQSAAESLARLQIACVDHGAELLTAGARDLRAPRLSKLRMPFLEAMAELMELQVKYPPQPLSAPELCWLSRQIEDSLDAMAALDIPDTLGSSDLNPGNVIVRARRARFLDWSETYIGHPFFSFAYLLEHFRRSVPGSDDAELVAAYVGPWRSRLSSERIAVALEYAPLLAVFAYAAGSHLWRRDRGLTPETSGYLRALVRRMNFEATKRCELEGRCRK
jgi:Phosphotransferase enzyme family